MISDNGSTDESLSIARSYADQLPDLVIVDSSAQPGAGYARNVGANATAAPLLAFCDADDEVALGWLAAMVAALEENPFVAGRFDAVKLNDPATLRSRSLQQCDGLQESPFGPDLPHAGAGNLGVCREVFFGVNGFDPAVGCLEDTDLCWRIQLTGVPLVFCPGALMHVRLRSSLRSMWGQGKAYGMAAALLEDRYPAAPQPDQPTARKPGTGRAATVISLLRDRSLGSLLWTVGWHIGHRQWRPSGSADSGSEQPVSAEDNRAADAA